MTLGLGDLAFLGSLQPSSTLLLDLYPNAAAAYSLRQLRTGVTNVVRLQRSSDLVEADFTAAQVANGEMATWVGVGNNGYVRTWYDQSGNGRNAGIAANPLGDLFLVENGIVVSQNGKPAIRNKFSNVLATSFQLSFPFSALFVNKKRKDWQVLSFQRNSFGHIMTP